MSPIYSSNSKLMARAKRHYMQGEWSQTIAVGSKTFKSEIKKKLGIRTIGRKALGHSDLFQLLKQMGIYNGDFDTKIEKIAPQNSYFWMISYTFSAR